MCFVADYVELDFNGPVLRALAAPCMLRGGSQTRFPEPGSRDALCELIQRVVESATEERGELRVRFEGGLSFVVPLANPGGGPEAAHFIPSIDGRRNGAAMIIWENVPT